MASVEMNEGGDHVVELVANDGVAEGSPEITPLLGPAQKPKINIFSVSYVRKTPREQVTKIAEAEISSFIQVVLWIWSGSKYSGLMCMAISSVIYFIMEILSDIFPVRSVPLFQIIFTRCTIILISSFVWLRRTGLPIFGQSHVRKLLSLRALLGFLSLLSFVYSIQALPLSQAVVLNFTTPIMASIAARIILHEKPKISDIGGLACSFFGLLFIFRPALITQGGLAETEGPRNTFVVRGSRPFFAVLVGLFSSVSGGITYCLIRAGAKASDQTVGTVFSFGLLATPAAAICTFVLQDFVFPDFYSLVHMVVLGGLAFVAEVFLARGLQLEKTSKVANIQYIEVFLSQMWSIGLPSVVLSFGRIVGCVLIVVSVCSTVFFGPEKEVE
ncbi:uncharacterized protein LOC122074006 isoform X1 [Macadamia integrifolia]|uniref:uncharacterized protein LOC122074006 isoform X1 n=1 Tax=Macadamia integrifolia TaxID=60698 RepID=UPI001C5011CF|nr:uncharacterized protein LOC122074006 isoform X1 [Macadamia integrifolia]